MNELNEVLDSKVKENKNSNFLMLMLGRIISEIGSSMFKFALSLYVLDITGSSVAFSTVLGFSLISAVIVNVFGGIIADKYNRKKILIVTDILCGIIILTFIPIFNLSPNKMLWLSIYVIIMGALQALFELTISAVIPNLFIEEDVGKANSALQSVYALLSVFGAVLGSIAYSNFSMNTIFLIDASSFIIAGMLSILLKYIRNEDNMQTSSEASYIKHLSEIFEYLKENKIISFFLAFTSIISFVFSSMVLLVLPYIGYSLLKVSAIQLSLMQAAWFAGTIIGAIFVSTHKAPDKLASKFFFFLMIQAVLLTFWIFPVFTSTLTLGKWIICVGYMLLLLLLGVFNTLQSIPVVTYFQNNVPENIRARFFGIFNTAILLACPLGMFMYGALLNKVHWASLPVVSGCCMFIVGLIFRNSKYFKMYLSTIKSDE